MTMTKRDGVYYADLRGFGGERVSLKTRDPELAKVLYRKAVLEMDTTAPKGASKMTLVEAFRRCRSETKWATAKDQRGITSRWERVVLCIPADTPLHRITRDTMSQMIGKLRKDRGMSDKTINRHLALLSKVLRWAADGGHLDAMPSVPWVETDTTGRIRFYSEDEERRILKWFEQNDLVLADLTVFLLDTGWRIGEATSQFQVDGDRAVLWDQKGGRRSATPLTQRARRAVNGLPWEGLSVDQVYKRWIKMQKAVGLDETANVHACRHTTATRLAQRGVPPHQIQAFMRHADIRTTMIYVHLAAGDLEACAQALEVCQEEDDEGTVSCGTVCSATETPMIPLQFLAPRPGLEPGTCGLTVRATPDKSSD